MTNFSMPNFSARQEIELKNLAVKLLTEKGFSYLSELLNKEKEIALLRTVKEYALVKAKNGRLPRPQLLKKYKIKISLVPPSQLPAICALYSDHIEPTPLGEIIKGVYLGLEKHGVSSFLLLTDGGAKEALGTKPPSKSRIFKGKNLTIEDYFPPSGPPKIDGDFVLITDNVLISNEDILIYTKEQLIENPLEMKVMTSKSRPFNRIDIGKVYNKDLANSDNWTEYWHTYGHIFAPEFRGKYSYEFTLLQNLMGNNDADPLLLVIPTETREGFIGVHINFFPKQKLYLPINYQRFTTLTGSLKPAVINWFEIALPYEDSPSEALCHLLHFLRTSTWDDLFFVDSNAKNAKEIELALTKRSQRRNRKIHGISELTSLRIAKEIVHPIAANSELIVKDKVQMWQSTNRLITFLKPMLNGDPFIGLIYLLSAGENPTDAPVYGTGFIDPKGFFPELYEFLHTGDRLDKLIKLMAETEAGPAMKGWPAFLNFLYQETNHDIKHLARLLNPNFCSMEIYPTLVEDFISKDLNLSSPPASSTP